MKICVLGAGVWGSTLATLLAEKKFDTWLWEPDEKKAEVLKKQRLVPNRPVVKIHPRIKICSDIHLAISNSKFIVFAVPSQFFRQTLKNIKFKNAIFVIATKGMEPSTSMTMSKIVAQEMPEISHRICILSGPSFAIEVSQRMPTAMIAASKNEKIAKSVQKIFSTKFLRIYTHNDVIGTEIGGALKNVIAIAAGICDGLGLGYNAKAAIITRGLREIMKIGISQSKKLKTFLGLSGVGDLIATSFSKYSRNRIFGEKIGKGISPEKAKKEIGMTIEGINATKAAYLLGKKIKQELPIINEIYKILFNNKSPKNSMKDLLSRKSKPEIEKLSISGKKIFI